MLSALDFARRLESGELTPARAIDICAEAIAKREAEVGAFVTLDLDGARRAAQSEALKSKPLRGMPVALKDVFDTQDMPTEYGSKLYAGYRPKADASLVTLTKRFGGVILGKTVTTEFAHSDPGKTRNPRNTAYTPGGSSSGSAAAVAAGFVPVPPGTQTGKQFRLKGKGMPILRSRQTGDMYVQVSVETPQNLTKKQQDLLAEFEKLSSNATQPEALGFFSKVKDFFGTRAN